MKTKDKSQLAGLFAESQAVRPTNCRSGKTKRQVFAEKAKAEGYTDQQINQFLSR